MSLAKLYSRAIYGIQAPQIVVEVHVANGLPNFTIVGLADTEVKESRERVRSAIQNAGYQFPARRITVNLAPADLPKQSSRYDLPIALGILLASNLIHPTYNLDQFEFAGELALDGELRPISGALALALGLANEQQPRQLLLPLASAEAAAQIRQLQVIGTNSLQQVVAYLSGQLNLPILTPANPASAPSSELNFNQVKGQTAAKKALEIAAAGRHSLLMIGNPGCGKSLLANRLPSILPELAEAEALECATIYSLTKHTRHGRTPPFRAPHHSASGPAIIGGGSSPQPGEISLAHNGVLFLDELPEFQRQVLEMLREPLESRQISLARARYKVEYPADFQLLAAMNPCPCGYLGHPRQSCKCSPLQINRYRAKISGPVLDRIDMVIEVPLLTAAELSNFSNSENSNTVKLRVTQARNQQLQRQGKLNAQLTTSEIEQFCALDCRARATLARLQTVQSWSARTYFRQLRLARTIADLDQSEAIQHNHLSMASLYKLQLV